MQDLHIVFAFLVVCALSNMVPAMDESSSWSSMLPGMEEHAYIVGPMSVEKEEYTALHVALLENTSPQIVQILINTKANVNKHDKEGNTALIIAWAQNYSDIIIMLLKTGAV